MSLSFIQLPMKQQLRLTTCLRSKLGSVEIRSQSGTTVSGTLHYKITATGDCQSTMLKDLTVKPDVSLTLLSGQRSDGVYQCCVHAYRLYGCQ
ncbi:hypothetical protein CS542_07830 [Pedobacter sp. IW39]|nr:hypothetical protein CS542_07830 [Pedobacter sp. IW39]